MAPVTDEAGAVTRLRTRLRDTQREPRNDDHIYAPEAMRGFMDASTLAKLRPAAVLVPIVLHAGAHGVLLTRRSESLRSHTGQISFPGGARDTADASFAATALREAQEEVGLDPRTVEVLGYLDDFPTLTGYRITPVVGLVLPPLKIAADPREVHSVFELPFADVLAPERFTFRTLKRGELAMTMPELQHGEHRVWGATAAILWHLHEQLMATGP